MKFIDFEIIKDKLKFILNNKISITLLCILILCLIGLIWLGLAIAILLAFYYTINYLITYIKNTFFQKVLKGFLLFFVLLTISIGVKLFWFEIYIVPSSSMENTLYPNDVIVVNKLKYGPNLPASPADIPWVNLLFYFNEDWRESTNVKWWENKRLQGITKIKNGDLLLFTMPFNNSFNIVKRSIAKGGDTIKIRDGVVYINNHSYNPTNLIKNEYLFKKTDEQLLLRMLDSLNTDTMPLKISDTGLAVALSIQDMNKLEKLGLSSSKIIDTLSRRNLYPEIPDSKWNLDHYGPLIIPFKGMKIDLNSQNYNVYNKVINDFEGVEIKEYEDSFLINNNVRKTYVFKQDYFFMMGDNRKQSSDSRFFGFVPKSRIIGGVQCVLYSNYKDKFRWDRMLKPLN